MRFILLISYDEFSPEASRERLELCNCEPGLAQFLRLFLAARESRDLLGPVIVAAVLGSPVSANASVRTPPEEQRALEAADRAMALYADGDDAAFATVFAAVGPRVHRFLRRLCGADDLAGDLLQETLLRMHQARGAFRPGAAVLPWSYTIARNVFLDSARSRKRRPVPLSSVEPRAGVEVPVGAEAESALLARETARAVERTLAAMTEARREAFVLIRFEGMSVADAAEILGTTENAVKLRAFQAYEAIREALAGLEKGRRA